MFRLLVKFFFFFCCCFCVADYGEISEDLEQLERSHGDKNEDSEGVKDGKTFLKPFSLWGTFIWRYRDIFSFTPTVFSHHFRFWMLPHMYTSETFFINQSLRRWTSLQHTCHYWDEFLLTLVPFKSNVVLEVIFFIATVSSDFMLLDRYTNKRNELNTCVYIHHFLSVCQPLALNYCVFLLIKQPET